MHTPPFSTLFLLLINHHNRSTAYSLTRRWIAIIKASPFPEPIPLFSIHFSPPPPFISLSFRLFFLGSLAHFLSPYRSATWKFHPPVIISPPPPLPHNRGHRLRRSKESTWRDEGRRNISLRSEFRETLLFDLMNEKCHCWKKKKRKNDEHNVDKYKFHRNTRILFFFLFSKIYIIEKEEREREKEIKMEERENRMKYTLVCPLTRFLSKSRRLVRKRING